MSGRLEAFVLLPAIFWAAAVCAGSAYGGNDMVPLPGGTFMLGAADGEGDETPARKVTLSPFRIHAREVTAAQYDTCVRRGACSPAHYDDSACLLAVRGGFVKVRVPSQVRHPDYPVVCVSWRQARQYCRFIGGSLPSEAQWEYASLAGGAQRYSWGDAPPTPQRCTPADRFAPRPVASHAANAWGLFDMTGNVWEWVDDRYQRDRYTVVETVDPRGPVVGRYRVIRGGGWYSTPAQLRLKNRHWFAPERGEVSIGFRCVKSGP